MTNRYREDSDLAFLQYASQPDLDTLVNILIRNKDGSIRFTENLTHSQEYQTHAPAHHRYWKNIAAELQEYGANTLVTMVRGTGVPYKEILIDVCKTMKVNFNKESSTERIESCLLMKVLTDTAEQLSEEELRELAKQAGITHAGKMAKPALLATLQGAVHAGGFAAYQLTVIIANSIARQIMGHGLSLAANASLTKGLSLLVGPVGLALSSVWTISNIAGPAYRVTIPACLFVACIRQKRTHHHNQGPSALIRECTKCGTKNRAPLDSIGLKCGKCSTYLP